MKGIKKLLTLLCALAPLAACQDDLYTGTTGGPTEGTVDIYLSGTDMPRIVTRADDDTDNRVDHVVLFAFAADGTLLNTPAQQNVHPVANQAADYYFRAYLPDNWATLYAVCNYDDPEGLTDYAKSEGDLNGFATEITSAEDAFKGVYVMTGSLAANDVQPDSKIIIPLTRTVSRHTFRIVFDPENAGDDFKLSSVSLIDVPARNYLTAHTEDAASTGNTSYYLGTEDAPALLEFARGEKTNTYVATTHLYDNRRGALTDDDVDTKLGITGYPDDEKPRIRQLFKRALAQGQSPYTMDDAHPHATCLAIDGLYDGGDMNSFEVRYYIYLGKDNFGDFNVERNTDYTYEITIRACDDIDTRVTANPVGDIEFNVSKADQPFDAHFNVREALLYSSTGWTVYVKDPDQHPWLEVSTSPAYQSQELGAAGNDRAQFCLKGGRGLQYLYIHTDEYVPSCKNADGSFNTGNNANLQPRTGEIIFLYDGQTEQDAIEKGQVYTVTQYPAQLLSVTAWDISQAKNVTRYFFVERITEEKYKDWGFRGFWNLTLDNLISTGNYDGLSNTRKEYVSAIWGDKESNSFKARQAIPDPAPLELDGAQDAAYWGDADEETDGFQPQEPAIFNLSTTFALGYALAKNRDRNNNGRIDYDEILWYLPARRQLEAIKDALDENTLYGPNTGTDADGDGIPDDTAPLSLEGNYWSSTPSVSDKYGITPGRAYYYDMSGGKHAIGLRDQSYGVIVCRDADGWMGPETGGGQGNVDNDTDWDDNEHNMPGR
ncbi:MAG TPA: DUF4906 domain-containing protein [Candidatus Bacteroides intestinavium]|uniref:DUF4906 domain-containing protein n=1 Tax=Candidatus Bacteroides intestinavium TaxID=2838469 RepID=A0A9D2KUS3_9BACE|nr:DUF4906 domain-containing protein [Candidatus Bacteroides intestinavium]